MKISIRGSYDFGKWLDKRKKISAKTKTTSGENPETISSPPFVWFILLDGSTGEPFMGTSADKVFTASLVTPNVDQFRDAVPQ